MNIYGIIGIIVVFIFFLNGLSVVLADVCYYEIIIFEQNKRKTELDLAQAQHISTSYLHTRSFLFNIRPILKFALYN